MIWQRQCSTVICGEKLCCKFWFNSQSKDNDDDDDDVDDDDDDDDDEHGIAVELGFKGPSGLILNKGQNLWLFYAMNIFICLFNFVFV